MIDTDVDQPPPPPAPPRKRRRWLKVLVILVLLGLLALGGATAFFIWGMGGSDAGQEVTVEIPEGASGSQIASILEDEEVIRSALVFRIIARMRGVDTGLRPGVYEMRTELGVDGVISLLEQGVKPDFVRFTVPEGKTVVEIARIVADATHITEDAFLEAARSGEHRLPLLPRRRDDLEGLLFPKTYDITDDMSAGEVIELMLGQFRRETDVLDFSKAEALGVSPYEIVIIASLIEREAKVQKDRPLISSVLYNRLARPMRLQIDATVQYAILLETGSYKQPLTREDYTRWRSPYNTYLNDGLPPGPIASPGLASIEAALNPADTDFFFYRLSGDGQSHCFSRDTAGHARCANQ